MVSRIMAVVLAVGFGLTAAGCGSDGENLLPVEGVVTLDGKPLTVGGLTFHPDTSKGNTTLHQPVGELGADGRYKLTSGGKAGAPPGWYKVLVFSSEQMQDSLRGGAPTDPKWLIHRKFTDAKTTPLSVEVVADPKEGAYDLVVTR